MRMGRKETMENRIDRIHNRIKAQVQKRRLAAQKKQRIEKREAAQPYKRPSTEKKRPLNNAYLNFLREYRRTHASLRPEEMMKRSARAWVRMSDEQKAKYRGIVKNPSVSIFYLSISSNNLN